MNRPSQRMRNMVFAAGAVVAAATLPACGNDTPSRAEVVGALTDELVPTRFEELAVSAAELHTGAETFCEGDRSDPAALLGQVSAVRDRWAALRPFWFGPAMDRRSRSLVDYPADAADVAELAASDTPVDPDSLRELVGADQRGLGAIEILATDDPGDRECEYLVSAATLVADETTGLAADWDQFGPTLSVDDAAANAALTDIVSETLFALPLTSSDNPMAVGQLAGARWAMLGDDGATDNGGGARGIAPLLDASVVDQLTTEFDAHAAQPSFDTEMALERTIKTNVAGDLGITVKFSDADGDG
ncbi:MAG: hypothetical protein IPM43_12680 [Actinomycetota bacterium]|nr:MAG: hypothetical protein IPM43_12680 [Actinomycetota bacterium]